MWSDSNVRFLEDWKYIRLELSEGETVVTYLMWSGVHQKKLYKEHKDLLLAPEYYYSNRLCTALFYKKDYMIHSRNVKYYLQKGIELI